jgi:hypothetical protein
MVEGGLVVTAQHDARRDSELTELEIDYVSELAIWSEDFRQAGMFTSRRKERLEPTPSTHAGGQAHATSIMRTTP